MTVEDLTVLDGLPPIACMAPVPWPRATDVDVFGVRRVRRCTLPNGHGAFDIKCRWEWHDEHVGVRASED